MRTPPSCCSARRWAALTRSTSGGCAGRFVTVSATGGGARRSGELLVECLRDRVGRGQRWKPRCFRRRHGGGAAPDRGLAGPRPARDRSVGRPRKRCSGACGRRAAGGKIWSAGAPPGQRDARRCAATSTVSSMPLSRSSKRPAASPTGCLLPVWRSSCKACWSRRSRRIRSASAASRGDAVRLLTAHRSKGLEWEFVVVAGVQEGGWPDLRLRSTLLEADALASADDEPSLFADDEAATVARASALVDERRLFYVAITRARRRLMLTAVSGGGDAELRPSRFLGELGVEVPTAGRDRRRGSCRSRRSSPSCAAWPATRRPRLRSAKPPRPSWLRWCPRSRPPIRTAGGASPSGPSETCRCCPRMLR